jgi:hypothetical protein
MSFNLIERSISAPAWVNFFYGGNRNYLNRRLREKLTGPSDEFTSLSEVCLGYDQTRLDTGLDFRLVSTLECHCEAAVSIKSNIVWLGAPAVLRRNVQQLINDSARSMPEIFYYSDEPERGNLPADLIAKSRTVIEKYSALKP